MGVVTAMDFSIIICTYNRASLVTTLVHQLLQQKVSPSLSWEILVVDNNSSDATASDVGALSEQSKGRVAYVLEAHQGKSFALNTGIEKSRGEVLVFIDDDIAPVSGWLQAYVDLFSDPECVGAGGRILPAYEVALPGWFDPEGSFPFKFDFGDQPCKLIAPPFGANMAYRRNVFEQYGCFRTDLGPSGKAAGGLGEDSEFGSRLLRDGRTLIYCSEALVHHRVTAQQVSREFLLDWHRRYGRSLVSRGELVDTRTRLLGVPRFLLRKVVEDFFRWFFTFGKRSRFYNRLALVRTLGTIAQCRENAAQKRG